MMIAKVELSHSMNVRAENLKVPFTPLQQIMNLPHLQMAYLEWYLGQEPLLLLHGMADHGMVWASLAEVLKPSFHILAPDLRGHGNSSKPLNGYRCDDIINDLEVLMARKGWKSTHVVAHSWSAKVATVWAKQNPQAIRSLVLIDPFFINSIPRWLKPTFPLLYRILPFLKMLGPFETHAQAEQQARKLKQYKSWSDLQQAVFEAGIEQKPDGQWGSKFVVQARDEIFEDMMETDGLSTEIAIPTLFVQPKQGLNCMSWQIKPYRTFLKNLQIIEVPGNHWCFLVEPAPLNHALKTFLESRPKG